MTLSLSLEVCSLSRDPVVSLLGEEALVSTHWSVQRTHSRETPTAGRLGAEMPGACLPLPAGWFLRERLIRSNTGAHSPWKCRRRAGCLSAFSGRRPHVPGDRAGSLFPFFL